MDHKLRQILNRSEKAGTSSSPILMSSDREFVICRLLDGINAASEYGLVVYVDLQGQYHCVSFMVNLTALPAATKISEVLTYFFDEFYAIKGYTLVSWANKITLHRTLWGRTVVLVGSIPVASFLTSSNDHTYIGEYLPLVGVTDHLKQLIAYCRRDTGYKHPVFFCGGSKDLFDTQVIRIPENDKHQGVFLNKELGLAHATTYLKADLPEHIVQIVQFPSTTKIVTPYYLDGLFGEILQSCPSVEVFLQRFKVSNFNNADTFLREWAIQTRHRKPSK